MIVLNAKYLKELKDITIPRHELNKIGIDDPQNLDMYVILRVKPDSKQFVANTKAPLIINKSKQTGNQVIIEKEGLMSDYPLDITNQKNVDK
jgi:flagellar assembly factor FliW